MALENHLRSVRCVLEIIPTTGERAKHYAKEIIVAILAGAYLMATAYLSYMKLLDIATVYHRDKEISQKIENGEFVVKKGAKNEGLYKNGKRPAR